jgi:tetratricopeptide (TPR) repeat protein
MEAPGYISAMLCAVLVTAVAGGGCGKSDQSVEYQAADGKKATDIKAVRDGKVSYQVMGKGSVPPKAAELHRQARAKGASGDHESAIKLLEQAIAIAPDWAYPHYDLAFTYLLQGDPVRALAKYREVDRLEPAGFFTAKTAIWSLEREEKGEFPKGTYLAYVSLEWAEAEEKRETIERMTTSLPSFAPAWKAKASLLTNSVERLQCIDMGLSQSPDPETYGILMLNKAALLNTLGKKPEAQQLIQGLITNQTSTSSTRMLAKEILKTF